MNPFKSTAILLLLIMATVALSGCTQVSETPTNRPDFTNPTGPTGEVVLPDTPEPVNWADFQTYDQRPADLILEDGKPVIFLFSTTGCPHCVWIKDTFDSTVQEYVDSGQIAAYHWELNTGDNTLTAETESEVNAAHMALWQEVNPRGSIPTFVLGGVYTRIGTGYERNTNYNGLTSLEAEEAELRDIIEELIAHSE